MSVTWRYRGRGRTAELDLSLYSDEPVDLVQQAAYLFAYRQLVAARLDRAVLAWQTQRMALQIYGSGIVRVRVQRRLAAISRQAAERRDIFLFGQLRRGIAVVDQTGRTRSCSRPGASGRIRERPSAYRP